MNHPRPLVPLRDSPAKFLRSARHHNFSGANLLRLRLDRIEAMSRNFAPTIAAITTDTSRPRQSAIRPPLFGNSRSQDTRHCFASVSVIDPLTALTYAEIVSSPADPQSSPITPSDDSGSVISMPPATFRRHVRFLAEAGIPVRPLAQALTQPGFRGYHLRRRASPTYRPRHPSPRRAQLSGYHLLVTKYCVAKTTGPANPTTNLQSFHS